MEIYGSNITKEYCLSLFVNSTSNSSALENVCCGYLNDTVLTWYPTPAQTYAIQQCPQQAFGVIYNINENASRFCNHNGIWEDKVDYERCFIKPKIYNILGIWCTGYALSMITLLVALVLLRYFRSLRCLRNEIHCNLIISYIIRVFMWYINILPQIFSGNYPHIVMRITLAILQFSTIANFFWMLVEGLYLFTIIVWTYGVEKYNIWHYSVIGWGIPFTLAIVAIVSTSLAVGHVHESMLVDIAPANMIRLIVIYIPILVSIVINVFVVSFIIYTLVVKVKQTKPTVRRNSSKFTIFSLEYKKAIKAAVVLIPLLGISHCLVVINQTTLVFKIINALLSSTQGFFVALIYCFLNREVRFVVGARFRSFRGLLPNSNRMRHTIEESVCSGRRSISVYKVANPSECNNLVQCQTLHSISDSTVENVPVTREPLIVEET